MDQIYFSLKIKIYYYTKSSWKSQSNVIPGLRKQRRKRTEKYNYKLRKFCVATPTHEFAVAN